MSGAAGSSLELVAADITQAATLLPEMFVGVRGMVIASAVKVVPKEGDSVDRAKYLQVGRQSVHIHQVHNGDALINDMVLICKEGGEIWSGHQ